MTTDELVDVDIEALAAKVIDAVTERIEETDKAIDGLQVELAALRDQRKVFVSRLSALQKIAGVAPSPKTPKSERRIKCPWPDCEFAAHTERGLKHHTTQKHKPTTARQDPPPVPKPEAPAAASLALRCSEPGCGFECAGVPAMSLHTSRNHHRQPKPSERTPTR